MNIDRRSFMRAGAALTGSMLASQLGDWVVPAARAQAFADYRALVCVFLFGGNDSNNMVVPLDEYGQYAAVRTTASGVALAQADLLPVVAPRQGGKRYGLHPALAPIAPLYAAGQLAVVANTGPLVAPITRADYLAGRNRPPNLYSHSDQQALWQGQIPGTLIRSGWGGRVADALPAANVGATVPMIVSTSGAAVFGQGQDTTAFVIPSSGGVTLSGAGTSTSATARYTALKALLGTDGGNDVFRGAAGVMNRALSVAEAANPILTATLPTGGTIATAFGSLGTGIANQLKQVARLVEARMALGMSRQVFFVGLGGFDNHTNLLSNQASLYGQLAPAIKAFHDYTVAAGVASNVTTYTMSDFSRTFIANATQGTDHAWGAHHLVLGGGVRGGDIYGTYPQLVRGGSDDAGSNGVWIPTTSVDQFGATLATWFGLPGSALPSVFPNLASFSAANLGFMA